MFNAVQECVTVDQLARACYSENAAVVGGSAGMPGAPGDAAAARGPLRELIDDQLLERSRDQAGGLWLTGELGVRMADSGPGCQQGDHLARMPDGRSPGGGAVHG